MGVVMSDKKTTVAFFNGIGLHEQKNALDAKGLKISLGYSTLIIKDSNDLVLGVCDLACQTTSVLKGSLGYSAINAVKKKVESFLTSVLEKKDTEGGIHDNKKPIEILNIVNPSEELKKDAVDLSKATNLYQPVNGTSKGSIYYVVAISDEDIKIAVRLKNTFNPRTSVRVVVPETYKSKYSNKFKELGLKDNTGYYSGHFILENTTPEKFIGAILFGLGFTYKTGIPDINLLKGL